MSNYKFSVLAICALLAVFVVSQTSLARQTFFEVKSDLEGQTVPTQDDLKIAFYAPDSPIGSCLNDFWYALPHSNTYKKSDWDMSFRQYTPSNVSKEQMIDLNGDGLVDYQFVNIYELDQSSGNIFRYQSCVYLNTGSGFEQVHQCYAEVRESDGTITAQDYYGDCAG